MATIPQNLIYPNEVLAIRSQKQFLGKREKTS
jgi:hypothetical protein